MPLVFTLKNMMKTVQMKDDKNMRIPTNGTDAVVDDFGVLGYRAWILNSSTVGIKKLQIHNSHVFYFQTAFPVSNQLYNIYVYFKTNITYKHMYILN